MENLGSFQPLACMKQPTGLIYHYTDLEVLLDCVIKKGTLKAGHIRFSNDEEEYIIGRELFCKIERSISKILPAIFAR